MRKRINSQLVASADTNKNATFKRGVVLPQKRKNPYVKVFDKEIPVSISQAIEMLDSGINIQMRWLM